MYKRQVDAHRVVEGGDLHAKVGLRAHGGFLTGVPYHIAVSYTHLDVYKRQVYFEAALIIAMLSFVGTVALSKYVMRRDIVE